MDKKKPGALDALIEAANLMARSLEEPMNRLADALYGVTIRRSEHVKRGEIMRLEANRIHGRTIVMHPLDAIAAEFPRDYITQSLEVGIYFSDLACAQLDAVNESLHDMADLFADRQACRMAEWMEMNGVTREDLAAAKYISLGKKWGISHTYSTKLVAQHMRIHPGIMEAIEAM